jgi:hypothetical protein
MMVRPTLYLYKNKDDELPSETINVATWNDYNLYKEYLDAHLIIKNKVDN